jgi:hypothetical protein
VPEIKGSLPMSLGEIQAPNEGEERGREGKKSASEVSLKIPSIEVLHATKFIM